MEICSNFGQTRVCSSLYSEPVKISPHSSSSLSRVQVYRQDPAVSGPSEETIDKTSIGERLLGPRMGIVTGRGEFKASADRNGDYLYQPGNKRFTQVQAFVSAQKTLDLLEKYADRELPWAFGREELGVIPHAGEGKNAYYARWNKSVAFYSFESRPLKKTVHVAQSADVVSHETGHAILDGMKPEWGKTFDKETKATHEAFGDCSAMLLAVSRPENRAQALQETGGDLRQDNVISSIAEEFGTAVRLVNRDPHDDKPYLRDSNNEFTYQPPSTLPRDGSREELSAEPHSFCQVFTRAFYNSLVGIYEQELTHGTKPDQALSQAADIVGGLLAKGITMSAPNRARFADVALGMLRADQLSGGRYLTPLRRAFEESRILTASQIEELNQPLPQGKPEKVLAALGLSGYSQAREVADGAGYRTLEFIHSSESTQANFMGLAGVPVSVDVTAGVSLTYDGQGRLVHLASQAADPQAEWNGAPDGVTLLGSESNQEVRMVPTATGYKLEKLAVFQD